ncbi:MAG: NAD(+)/NADH kinase [Spirochaetia bacterium]|nr:NAD(+)/NADH kinase [Spirochaetia bacterium]MCF7946459.1 NAD(+)/NADH kinase [Spirochaetia bacterium]
MRKIKRVLLVVNIHKDEAAAITQNISEYMGKRGIELLTHSYKKNEELPYIENIDLAISLGGDGTVLYCARIIQHLGIPILAVNLGTFGFITEIARHEWKKAFEEYEGGRLGISYRVMIRVLVEREGRKVFVSHGLNDVVVNGSGLSRIVRLRLCVNETHLGNFRSDGIIIATPTGSTAYSMAAGGPILDSDMDALILTPVCPFTLSNRPLVISGNDVITIEVMKDQRTMINLSIDGQEVISLKESDIITIEKSHSRALLIKSNKRNFYEVVRSKLKWSGG